MNSRLINSLLGMLMTLGFVSCGNSVSNTFELLHPVKSGVTNNVVTNLPDDNFYVLKFLDSDCTSCTLELEETIKLIEALEQPDVKLLILGKGRSEKRLEFTFYQLDRNADFYSFDSDGVYETNFVQKFQSLNNLALIQANGQVKFFGNAGELKQFINSTFKN